MEIRDFVNTFRQDYGKKTLDKNSVSENPFSQFELWISEATAHIVEPNAMVLATATKDGKPSARIMLLRGFDEDGFTFFTNYDSRKGNEIKENTNAALLFFWAELERQVRIEGTLSKVSKEVSDEYFATRPRDSQIGAWTSPQSQEIESREKLEERFAKLAENWDEKDVERPEHWGGFILKPEVFEFWQGRANRLHDRMIYKRGATGWEISRIAP